MSEAVISLENVRKKYGLFEVLKGVNIHVNKGDIYGLVGKNGAGKTTIFKIILGLSVKDEGTVSIAGSKTEKELYKNRAKIGFLVGAKFYGYMSAYDNLNYYATVKGIPQKDRKKEIERVLEVVGLNSGKKPFKSFSLGMTQRLGIANAILGNPEILILDEPTTGLDPQTRKLLWDVVETLRREKKLTVFLTTHYMEEAADADYVVIIDSGRIAAEGSPLELKNKYVGDYVTIYGADEKAVAALDLPYETVRDGFRVSVANTGKVTELIAANPGLFRDYEVIKGKMDDVFLTVTGKNLPGGALQ
jgi:multidrug/hemolysin transport system ATP-binding protein